MTRLDAWRALLALPNENLDDATRGSRVIYATADPKKVRIPRWWLRAIPESDNAAYRFPTDQTPRMGRRA